MIRVSSGISEDFVIEGLTPPQVVEAAEEKNAKIETQKVSLAPSPMSIFKDRESSNSHLAEKALNVPEKQAANGWYNPFAKFYGWVMQALYAPTDEKPEDCELTDADFKKIRLFSAEVRTALSALDALIAEDDEVKESFDELLMMTQRHKEALHKKTVAQQGEQFRKAHKEVTEIREKIKKETNEFLDKISRNGTINKLANIATPLLGLAGTTLSFAFLPGSFIPAEVGLIAKPVLIGLSAFAAANIGMDEPIGEQLSDILNSSLSAGLSLTQTGGVLLMFSQNAAKLASSWNRHSVNSYTGLMSVVDNKRRQAEEKYNDIGSKATSEFSKYAKGVSALAEMLAENLELIKRLWNR